MDTTFDRGLIERSMRSRHAAGDIPKKVTKIISKRYLAKE